MAVLLEDVEKALISHKSIVVSVLVKFSRRISGPWNLCHVQDVMLV